MKKLSFLFAMVFAVSMAMAQNTATTSVTGNNNEVEVGQQGDMQSATVTQAGNSNEADVDQYAESSSSGPGEQSATVTQTGNQNDAKIDMDQTGGGGKTLNTAVIDQIGNSNESDQKINTPGYNSGASVTGYQEGNSNDLDQTIYNGYTTSQSATQLGNNNKANQKSWGAYKDLDILTEGNYNEAVQSANGAKADLDINQMGDRNYAKQQFEGSFAFSAKNTGNVVQTGNLNDARQFMDGGTEGNDVDGTQIGNSNISVQRVNGNFNTNTSYVVGNVNEVRISQVGDNNNASNWVSGDRNFIKQTQEGFNNGQRVEITGDLNDVTVNQNGQANKTYLNLRGTGPGHIASGPSNSNTIKVLQGGEDNLISGSITGDNNSANVRQDGTSNMVGTDYWAAEGIQVGGNSNDIDILQDGDMNSADAYVLGNSNSVDVEQFGVGNMSTNNVVGNSNVISVTQSN